MIDRGWPDYQYPFSVNDLDVDNYRAFVDWKIETEGLYPPERFEIGSNKQIVLLKKTKRNIMRHSAFKTWRQTGKYGLVKAWRRPTTMNFISIIKQTGKMRIPKA